MDVKWRPARPGDAQPVLPPRSGDPYHKMPLVDSLGDIPADMLVPPRKKRRTAQQQAMDALAALLGASGPSMESPETGERPRDDQTRIPMKQR